MLAASLLASCQWKGRFRAGSESEKRNRVLLKLNFKVCPCALLNTLYLGPSHDGPCHSRKEHVGTSAENTNITVCDRRNATEEGWRNQRRGRKRQRQEKHSSYKQRSRHALTGSGLLSTEGSSLNRKQRTRGGGMKKLQGMTSNEFASEGGDKQANVGVRHSICIW